MRRSFGAREEFFAPLSDAEHELLARVGHGEAPDALREIWSPFVDSLEDSINRFAQQGLIEEASPRDKLNRAYRAAELRELMRKHGLRPRGKKPRLIEALIAGLTSEKVSKLIEHVELYRLTELGRKQLGAFEEGKRTRRLSMERLALEHLARGRVNAAADIIAEYALEQDLSREIGGTSSQRSRRSAADDPVLFLLEFPYDDLPLTEKQRHEVGQVLALSLLLGESTFDAGGRLLELTQGEFQCPALSEPLIDSRCRVEVYEIDPETPQDLAQFHAAELYARTRFFEAKSSCVLRDLKRAKMGEGISIVLYDQEACRICLGDRLDYLWSEINELPKLPRDWGCECLYTVWFSDDDLPF